MIIYGAEYFIAWRDICMGAYIREHTGNRSHGVSIVRAMERCTVQSTSILVDWILKFTSLYGLMSGGVRE